MSVRCPSCRAVPSLSAADLGVSGTMVRCARCGTRWLARRPIDDPYGSAYPLPALRQGSEIVDAVVIEEVAPPRRRTAPPPPPAPELPPRLRARPASAAPVRKPGLDRRLKVLGLVLGAVVLVIALRAPIVAALPGALPAGVERLEFRKIRSETVQLGKQRTLYIQGEIINRSGGDVPLPLIEITLRSDAGEPVTSWLVEPAVDGLAPGRSIGFRSALDAPPPGATQVSLRLAERVPPANVGLD